MVSRLSLRDKKGDSTVLGYVLLVVLAIGMATAVYTYLKFYLPKDQPTCPNDVSIIINEVNCTQGRVSISLQNKGLFNIDGAFIKVGEAGRVARQTINCPGPSQAPPGCDLYFTGAGSILEPLTPCSTWSKSYPYSGQPGTYEVEVSPVVVESNSTRLICEKAIVTQQVQCT